VAFQLFILGVGLPATVAACYAFHLVFERPFVKSRRAVSARVDHRVPRGSSGVERDTLPERSAGA
jgi:peptidoglycan/LPS O-acetylase OafA/YrhL